MTSTVRQRVLDAAQAVLAAIDIDDLQVHANRQDPVDRWPALVLHDGDQEPADPETGIGRYYNRSTLQGFVRLTDPAEMRPALNGLYGAAVAALMADVSLGGVAIDIAEGEMTTFMAPIDDRAYQAQFDLIITIEYATAEGDPFSADPAN